MGSQRKSSQRKSDRKVIQEVESASLSSEHDPAKRFRLNWRIALLIFVAAITYRGAYLFEASRKPDFNLFYMDQEYHLQWATALVTGEWTPPYDQIRNTPFFRAPLYPYFMAGMLAVSKQSTLFLRIAQIFLGSISCVLAYGVATKVAGRRVGGLTGLLCAVYWVLAYFDGELLLPVLLVFFGTLGFLLTFSAVERQKVQLAGLAGLAFGLFAITRPNILVFLPFLIWWTVRVTGRLHLPRRGIFVGLMVTGCVLPPALVTLRNRVVSGDWVVVASQGGVNFYIGNNPESNGIQAVVPGTRQTWWGGFEDTVAIAEEAAGRHLKPSEVSRYWFGRAFAYMREHPGDWFRLMCRKALLLVSDVEPANNEPYEARRSRFWTLQCVPLRFGPLVALFVLGMPILLMRRDAGAAPDGLSLQRSFASLILQFVLVYALTVVAFFVTGRYRVPLVPFIILGASVALVSVFEWLTSRRWLRTVGFCGAALVLSALLMVDHLHVRSAMHGFAKLTDAQDMLAARDLDGAIAVLEDIRREQSVRAPEVYTSLIKAYFDRNRPGDVPLIQSAVRDGLERYPRHPELMWYDVLMSAGPGRESLALEALDRYLEVRPDDVRALILGWQMARTVGDKNRVEAYRKQAQQVAPNHELVAKMAAAGGG